MTTFIHQRHTLFLFILSFLIAPGVFGSDKPETETDLPILVNDNRVIVELGIDGLDEQYFILDMAASKSVVSPLLKSQLKLNPDDITVDTVHGASGQRSMEFVNLPQVTFAGYPFDGIDAVVFESGIFKAYGDKNVQGILGVDVLRHFDLSINLNENLIKIRPVEPSEEDPGTAETGIPFESKAMPGFVEFEIDVNGTPMNAFFDTGGKQSILNWKAAEALGIDRDSEQIRVKESGTQGIDGGREETFLYTFDQLQIGPASLTNNEVKIADLPVFDLMGYSDSPVILIGIDFMIECSVDINYSSNTLELCED